MAAQQNWLSNEKHDKITQQYIPYLLFTLPCKGPYNSTAGFAVEMTDCSNRN